jgi:hypothetical protein
MLHLDRVLNLSLQPPPPAVTAAFQLAADDARLPLIADHELLQFVAATNRASSTATTPLCRAPLPDLVLVLFRDAEVGGGEGAPSWGRERSKKEEGERGNRKGGEQRIQGSRAAGHWRGCEGAGRR